MAHELHELLATDFVIRRPDLVQLAVGTDILRTVGSDVGFSSSERKAASRGSFFGRSYLSEVDAPIRATDRGFDAPINLI